MGNLRVQEDLSDSSPLRIEANKRAWFTALTCLGERDQKEVPYFSENSYGWLTFTGHGFCMNKD